MQFVLIARDAKDDKALERRMEHRPAHLEKVQKAIAKGEELLGGAMINEQGNMCGSVMVFDVPSREYLDDLLKDEPFITQKVWDHIEIIPIRLAPGFEHLIKNKG